MDEAPEGEVRSLRFLRVLVTVLTAVMIVGFIVLIGFLVTRFPGTETALPLPGKITLPDGSVPVAFTQGSDWYAVVTETDEILIYDRQTGTLSQTVQVQTTR